MPVKLTDSIVNERLRQLGYTKLEPYVNSSSPLVVKEELSGEIFTTTLDRIQKGHRPGRKHEPTRKYTIDNIKEISLSKYGLKLLSKEYKNCKGILEWEDTDTGYRFKRSWDSIMHGHTKPTNVNDYYRDKSTIESYKSLGYKYNCSEQEYLSAERVNGKRIFIITHPDLHGYWKVDIYHFKRFAISKLNEAGKSTGEIIISSILDYNNIDYESQISMSIKGSNHLFDFYLPEYDTYIEYDGIQHFEPVGYFGGHEGYIERVRRDQDKNEYVNKIGSHIIRISYINKSPKSIAIILKNKLNIDIKYENDIYKGYMKNVAIYYKNNTLKETEAKYKLSGPTIQKYYKLVYGGSKTDDYLSSRRIDIANYYNTHSIKETMIKYKVSRKTITNVYRTVYGCSKTHKK